MERICHATVGDFNPHSREGSDLYGDYRQQYTEISIHTPAKGVTFDGVTGWAGIMHFNPHSREGSDILLYFSPHMSFYFNPHSREGSDFTPPSVVLLAADFNPHSREGSDLAR